MLMAEPFDINEKPQSGREVVGPEHVWEKPKRHPKLKGQRLGQVVYNALHGMSVCSTSHRCDEVVTDKLFYISDEDLVKLINDYLKEQ